MQIAEELRLLVAEPLEVPVKIPTGDSYNQQGAVPELEPEPVSAAGVAPRTLPSAGRVLHRTSDYDG